MLPQLPPKIPTTIDIELPVEERAQYAAIAKNFGPEFRQKRIEDISMKLEGTGWDVGWAAVYFASDEARWVTGAEIPVDGGGTAILQG